MAQKAEEVSLGAIADDAPENIRHAHFVAIANFCKELLTLPEDRLNQAIKHRLVWAESSALDSLNKGWFLSQERYFWESCACGAIAIDDEMVAIGDRKIATHWKLRIGDKPPIILPPSTPIFVGWVGDDAPEFPFPMDDYIGQLYQWIRHRVIDESVCFLDDLKELIDKHPMRRTGKMYFTRLNNGVWELRWGRRKRALPIASDRFLLDLAEMLEKVARGEIADTQLWDWVDGAELGFECEGSFQGTKITLSHYEENGTWSWRLTHKRRPIRVRRYWVGAIANAIRSQDDEKIALFLQN